MSGLEAGAARAVGARMDRLYRRQRHVYDLTRRFSLLGRDRLLARVRPRPGGQICEVGCGTARNLLILARRHPDVRFYGLDASGAMLASAGRAVRRAGLEDRVVLARGLAEELDGRALFGLEVPFDQILFSYSLSMIGPWREALAAALASLRPGGALHLVDFGDGAGLSPPLRWAMRAWLSPFGVHLRADVPLHMAGLAALGRGDLRCQQLLGGYACLLTFVTAPATAAACNGRGHAT